MAYSFKGAHYLDNGAPQFPPRTHFTASNLPVLNVRDVNVDNSVTSKKYVDSKSGSVAYQLTNFYSASVKLVITDDDILQIIYDAANVNGMTLQLNNVPANTYASIDGKPVNQTLGYNDRVLVSITTFDKKHNGIYKLTAVPAPADAGQHSWLYLTRVDFTHNQFIPHHLHVPIEDGVEFKDTIWVHSSITVNAFSQDVIKKIIAGEIIDTSIIDQLVHVLKIGTDNLTFHKIGTAEPNSLVSGANQPINIKFNNTRTAQILNSSLTLYGFTSDDQGLTPNNSGNHGVNEIWGVNGPGSDYGILKLSAGGGHAINQKASIYLHGYNTTQGTSIRFYVGGSTYPRFRLTSVGAYVTGHLDVTSDINCGGYVNITGDLTVDGQEIKTYRRIVCTDDPNRNSVEMVVPGSNNFTGYLEFWKQGFRTLMFGYDHALTILDNGTFKIKAQRYAGNPAVGQDSYYDYLSFISEDIYNGVMAQIQTEVPFQSTNFISTSSYLFSAALTAKAINVNYMIPDSADANLRHAPFYTPGSQFILDPVIVTTTNIGAGGAVTGYYELLQWNVNQLNSDGTPAYPATGTVPLTSQPFRINENYMYNIKVLRYTSNTRYPTHPPVGMDSWVLKFKNSNGNVAHDLTPLTSAEHVIPDTSSTSVAGNVNAWTLTYGRVLTAQNVSHSSFALTIQAHQNEPNPTYWQLVITRIS